jgi:predicted  nucleic acid-binding Zn-ribbon protein
MSIARNLYQLQQVESEIEAEEKALAACLEKMGDSQAIDLVKSQIEATRGRLEVLQQQQRDTELEIGSLEAKLAEVKDKLYSGRINNPKELGSLQQEEAALQGQREKLEDDDLQTMEQVEALTADLAALDARLAELQKDWQQEQQQLNVEVDRLKQAIARLQDKRQQVLAGIDAATLERYNSLKKQKGWAVSRIEQGTCRSCRISLSTAELQRARGQQIVECNSCHRILFLE